MIFGSRRRRSGGNSNVLTFWTTCDNTSTFDPKITGVDGIWRFDDGSVLVGTSGVEIFKTFASGGLHWAKFYPGVGGLAAITAIDCALDSVTAIVNIDRVGGGAAFSAGTSPNLVIPLTSLSKFSGIYAQNTGIYGNILSLRRDLIAFSAGTCPGVVGSLSDLPSTLTLYCYLFSDTGVVAGSIAHIVGIRDIRIYSMGWLTADVDTVLLSASNAIWANLGHFTHVAPSLQIGGTNEAPGGTIGAATTSPLVTPGAGNSDADWLWVEGVSEHYPVSGCAAVYYMRNNVGHAWAVTITGEA